MLYRIAEFVIVVKLVEDIELREPKPFLHSTDESRENTRHLRVPEVR